MLLIGIAGHELTAHERDWLQHDACAGVILFARNFASRAQVAELTQSIREAAPRPQLICVDQEGGRVQRFRDGYTELPPLARLRARSTQRDAEAALALADEHAWLMASEMRASGVDLSFAPVVDLARGNRAIGDRAFSADPAGGRRVHPRLRARHARGRHGGHAQAFPRPRLGAGRHALRRRPIDPRPLDEIRAHDLVPFVAGIEAGADAVMMAHVTYPQVAPEPAGYSRALDRGDPARRRRMAWASAAWCSPTTSAWPRRAPAGGIKARIDAHLDAGCDVVLVCHPELVDESLAAVEGRRSTRWRWPACWVAARWAGTACWPMRVAPARRPAGRRARAVAGNRHAVGRNRHGRRGMSAPTLGDALASSQVLFDRAGAGAGHRADGRRDPRGLRRRRACRCSSPS